MMFLRRRETVVTNVTMMEERTTQEAAGLPPADE